MVGFCDTIAALCQPFRNGELFLAILDRCSLCCYQGTAVSWRGMFLPLNLPTGDHTMQCPRCQAENRAGRRFCAECGAPLALPCTSCGFSNEPEEKFCGGCGTPLTAAPRPPEPPAPAPQSYTPGHL